MNQTEDEHDVSLSFKRPAIRYCDKCRINETQFEDLQNGLSFCSHQCQRLYHRYDIESIMRSNWCTRRLRFLTWHLIESTQIVTNYMILSCLCDLYDIRELIISIMISPILRIYLHPTLINSHHSIRIMDPFLFMVSGNGLMNKIMDGHAIGRCVFHDLPKISLSSNMGLTSIVMHHLPYKNINYSFDTRVSYLHGVSLTTDDIIAYGKAYIKYNTVTQQSELWTKFPCWDRPCHDEDEWVQEEGLVDPYIVSYGMEHFMFIDIHGHLWGRGSNDKGQLGISDKTRFEIFTYIQWDLPCIDLSCHGNTSMYITIDGYLWVSGENSHLYQTGTLHVKSKRGFTRVEGIPPVYRVVCGRYYDTLIDYTGCIWVSNHRHTENDTCSFTKILGLMNVFSIYEFRNMIYAICSDDTRWVIRLSRDGTHCPILTPLDYLPILTSIETNETKRQRITQ